MCPLEAKFSTQRENQARALSIYYICESIYEAKHEIYVTHEAEIQYVDSYYRRRDLRTDKKSGRMYEFPL